MITWRDDWVPLSVDVLRDDFENTEMCGDRQIELRGTTVAGQYLETLDPFANVLRVPVTTARRKHCIACNTCMTGDWCGTRSDRGLARLIS